MRRAAGRTPGREADPQRSSTSPTAATAPIANAPRLPRQRDDAAADERAEPCDESKNDENVPTTDAALGSAMPASASSSSAGYMQRHADREDDRADDEPGDASATRRSRPMPTAANTSAIVPASRPPSRSGRRAPKMRTTRISTP